MASRNERRKNRVKTQVPIRRLLIDLGYRVRLEEGDRGQEEQYACDLHGDGHDGKPSARIYPDNTTHCFACGVSRDTLALVQAKMGIEFMDALEWLEKKYGFAPMPFEAEDEEPAQTPAQEIASSIILDEPYEKIRESLHKRLSRLTKDRDLPLDDLLKFWEAYDLLVYQQREKILSEDKAKRALALLSNRVLERLREVQGA